MTISRGLRQRLVDEGDGHSLGARLRNRRWRFLNETFGQLAEMTVLDLGGTARSWESAPIQPKELVLLNTTLDSSSSTQAVLGDACDPPPEITARTFDLVYSNSVIEHVGGHARMEQFAANARALASHYWIQTPYRYFPIEPHFLFPGLQFLPLSLRTLILKRWPLGHSTPAPDDETAASLALGVELLSRTHMESYFPDGEVHFERVLGMPKSLIAVR